MLSRNVVGGVLMLSSPIVGTNPHRVAGLTLAYKLPAITLFVEFAQSGGLLSYGPDNSAMYRQAGVQWSGYDFDGSPAITPTRGVGWPRS